jgi:uroporphyrinogen-III synthase
LAESLSKIGTYDHLVFTSVNGVYSFLSHIGSPGLKPGEMPSALCVGPKTAEEWHRNGGTVEAVPARYSAVDLAHGLGRSLDGASLLLLRPEHVETELAEQLRKRGAGVDEVVLYRTLTDEKGADTVKALLENDELDAVLFASPSAVSGTLNMAGGPDRMKDLHIVCIGPTTAKAAVDSGLDKVVFPERYTSEGMIQALLNNVGEAQGGKFRR